jgi:GNAT superfamily N-acetyltransferase
MSGFQLRDVGYDHPDAQRLITEVQAEYVQRYGGPDDSPVDPREFAPPEGLFAVGYLADRPVVMGGWRRHAGTDVNWEWARPAVEVKRMYVAADARGRGFARAMLAYLEDTARSSGAHWLLLETGLRQPEALELYRSAGYQAVPAFGHYADTELSVHLGKPLIEGAAAVPGPAEPTEASVQR